MKKKKSRLDRRRTPVNGTKRQCVVIMRESGGEGRILTRVFRSERQGAAWIAESLDRQAQIFADEGFDRDVVHATQDVQRVNHSKEFSTDEGVHTNNAKSLLSCMMWAENGIHHHVAGDYLDFHPADSAWREENSKLDDKSKVLKLIRAAMNLEPSRTFAGYWQTSGPRRQQAIDHDVLRALGANDD